MVNTQASSTNALPYRDLTSFAIEQEHQSERQTIFDRLENNGFADHLKTMASYLQSSYCPASYKQYFDIDEYVTVSVKKTNNLKVIHINIRRISKNRAQLIVFLSLIHYDCDILMISEIGDNAASFINKSNFPQFPEQFIDLPNNGNRYGGTAILMKDDLGQIVQLDLTLTKRCECMHCYAESTWVELKRPDGNNFVLGCVYRHNKGNENHFTDDLNNLLEKIDKSVSCIIGGISIFLL